MDNLTRAIREYAADPENAELNYTVARLYEDIGQTAAALSYFLRAAERTNDNLLAYECLLKIGLCFDRQGRRGNSTRGAFEQALVLLPKRPEAYFLLARYNERIGDHVAGYRFAEQGLNFCGGHYTPALRSWVEFPGKYGLTFQKAVSAWWWGRPDECRKLFQDLKSIAGTLDKNHYDAVQRNLTSLGCGSIEHAIRTYVKSQYPRLRFQFPGAENIERNYSGVYQDMFVLAMTNGKRGGTYLEVGSGDASLGSNTLLLEEFDWNGIGLEWDAKHVATHVSRRRNTVLQQDALKTDYVDLCSRLTDKNGVIDYLQLDCEPSESTYNILTMIPFDQFKFRVITYEHDHYVDMTGSFRQKSRDFLLSKGYTLLVPDVSADEKSPFEDWWVHEQFIENHVMLRMSQPVDKITNINEYMLTP
jgi:tetratricopeptide (TPR) repeat protein